MHFPVTHIRIARPTNKLSELVQFYENGLGLQRIGEFHDHAGYSGIMLGMPGAAVHLEFTSHESGSPCPAPTKDNLLVFYFENTSARNEKADRLQNVGYTPCEPENPYWLSNSLTFEDPDGWRIVLVDRPAFSQ